MTKCSMANVINYGCEMYVMQCAVAVFNKSIK